ncbi:MAG: hypothetical protein JXQ73_29460 [Phycisphaerae bacterium]|nr:hypothetical protein [Phycisphaerae bacterium]
MRATQAGLGHGDGWARACPWIAAAIVLALAEPGISDQDVPYGIATWPEELGNHRARIRVAREAEAVRVHIPWRRRDVDAEKKHVIIAHGATGKRVKDVVRVEVNREFGDLVFRPEGGVGEYLVYYLPSKVSGWRAMPKVTYLPPEETADAGWVARHGLEKGTLASGKWKGLPAAEVLEIQANGEFNRFDPMEVIATAAETQKLVGEHAGRGLLLFPEDRRFPVRMTDDLPLRWIRRGPVNAFGGEALRGEYYAFQVGVYAARTAARNISVEFADLRLRGGAGTIPAAGFTCFNVGGVDAQGRDMGKTFSVERGKVGALWIGVQIPKESAAGDYVGAMTLRSDGAQPERLELTLKVLPGVLEDRGDGEPWRHSRLRWLNSRLGIDEEVVGPYTPMTVDGETVGCLGRDLAFGAEGLPKGIRSGASEILAGPAAFVVETDKGKLSWPDGKAKVVKHTPARVAWESSSAAGAFSLKARATMEFDGYVNYQLALTAGQASRVGDIRLEIPLRGEAARYMMGMGRKGGLRPKEYEWKWDRNRHQDSVWVGSVGAGLQCKLKGPDYAWPLVNVHFKHQGMPLPDAWHNGGKGGCRIVERGDGSVALVAYGGPRELAAGQTLRFDFGLLITPVKPLDPDHWNQRYYHDTVSPEVVKRAGARIVNLHHASHINPYINYPFLRTEGLAAYVKQAHEVGIKAKIYYTQREITNHIVEIWAMRALGDRFFADGPGGGYAWLPEHLGSGYIPAWHCWLGGGDVCAALVQTGSNRWHNYYVESLRWLLRNVEIDGLYLDDVGYDRTIMQRVRKVLDRDRPGCLIDLHSWNHFNDLAGFANCANMYLELMPYVNSIWFGEGFNYNETPDYWLVEISGIPFGVFGEMLQDGGNAWRGMIYGMTTRIYGGHNPSEIWKLWDAFGIGEAKMIGYWDASCPVRTDNKDVLATAYCKEGKTLVSIASWAKERVECRLKIDWAALGLDASKASLFAPWVKGFQPTAVFKPTEAIPVSPGKGWLLIVDEEGHEISAGADAYGSRRQTFVDEFKGDRLGEGWTSHLSKAPGTAMGVAEGALKIEAKANCVAYIERALPEGTTLVECEARLGSDQGKTWGPGLCLVWPGGKVLRINLRAEGQLGVDDGRRQVFGGYAKSDAWLRLRIRMEEKEVFAEYTADGRFWEPIEVRARGEYPGAPGIVRLGKTSGRGTNEDCGESGPSGVCGVRSVGVFGSK